ncbi:deaminase [Pseudomonas huaxiensis]|uniref:deaminase n=1 Tax=Pseudomonas huaxiensis TaxID=2213017 RepID=UPI001CDD890A|nr:deaminase [Pseudomonas huaxiensis]
MSLPSELNAFSDTDSFFMGQALDQGRRALPDCLPNPPVGCVITRHGSIIASGYTQSPGQHHAEAMALSQLEQGLDDLTAYVTLEPCSFTGRTPSCALALIAAGIARVHVSMLDPDPRNAGAGVAMLRQAGIEVTVGLLEDQARQDLGPYLHRVQPLKALSIVSPNGGRIASGQKTLEVRRWHPHLDPNEDLLIVENERFLHVDGDEDDGHAVAIVRVRAVRPFVEADIPAACASSYAQGWLAWELTDVRPITPPVPVRAARGIYQVDFSGLSHCLSS